MRLPALWAYDAHDQHVREGDQVVRAVDAAWFPERADLERGVVGVVYAETGMWVQWPGCLEMVRSADVIKCDTARRTAR